MILSHKYSSFQVTVLLKFKSALEYGLFVSWFHLSSAFCGSAVLQQLRQFLVFMLFMQVHVYPCG
jgi:hypothetical protein